MILPQLELQSVYDTMAPFAKGAIFPAFPNDADDGTTNGWQTAAMVAAFKLRPPVFVCPSDESQPLMGDLATTSYALCAGSNGPTYGIDQVKVKHYNTGVFLYRTPIAPKDISDGLSKTIFVGETILNHTTESANRWMLGARHLSCLRTTDNPLNTQPTGGINLDLYGYKASGAFASRHTGGGFFAYGDGHVSFVSENVDLLTYRAISTRAGGETVTTP